jgi:zinc transport system substrate-binding protein
MRRTRSLILLLCASLLPLACSSDGDSSDGSGEAKPTVVAGAYPLAWLAEQVAGPDAVVSNLLEPGVEPHDVELTPRQVIELKSADVVVYIKGFQPAVDEALGDAPSVDLSSLQGAGSTDPHVWLDPFRMRTAVLEVVQKLVAVDPFAAPAYRKRGREAVALLNKVDATFTAALTGCARRDIVTSHAAFGYLADRYDLNQVALSGLSPDAEPTPARLAEVARFARKNRVTTIFFEHLVDPKVAKTVAAAVGATTAVLDPLEGVTGSDTYVSVMERNATTLRTALGCTG